MTRIKICGITNVEDARAAVDYGADALGFIFVRESPRYIGNDEDALEEVGSLAPFVVRVAVCKNSDSLEPQQRPLFDAVQFYEQDWYRPSLPVMRYFAAIRVSHRSGLAESLRPLRKVMPDAVVLDTFHKDKLGGSGETFDWEIAAEVRAKLPIPVILAGGLTSDNVGEAIAKVRPYAVDVSSGVEAEPGRKDHAKLKAFIRAVREADRLLES